MITTYGVVRSDAEELGKQPLEAGSGRRGPGNEEPAVPNRQGHEPDSAVESRMALTGTPVENRLGELWSIMNWAAPGLLGPFETFRRTVALPIERDDNQDAAGWLSAVIAPFLLRRRKVDPNIAPELPAKTERDVVVPLTAEQVTLYRATTEEAIADVEGNEGLVRQGLVLKMLTALKQITNHPAQYLGETSPLEGRSGKLAAMDDLVDAALAGGESTLIFSQYVAMGKLLEQHLAERGIPVGFLHGQLGIKQRQEPRWTSSKPGTSPSCCFR